MRHSMSRVTASVIVTAVALTILYGAVRTDAQVACGAVVAGDAVMTADINCPANDPAVQVNGGSLDMNGHRISGCLGTGISVIGAGSKVLNGSVNGCAVGVDLMGATKAKLTNVVAIANTSHGFQLSGGGGSKLIACAAFNNGANGFRIQASDNNSLSRCTASNNTLAGYAVQSSGNQIRDSLAVNNGSAGIDLNGTANNVSRNTLVDNDVGLAMAGSGKIADNRATASTGAGFLVSSGTGPKLTKNVAAGNGTIGFDLVGQNALKNDTAARNGAEGFRVSGTLTTLNSCIASNNVSHGLELLAGSTMNTINGSLAMANGGNGILLDSGASTNTVVKDVLLESGDDDAQDDNANCDGNGWDNNILRTKEAGGVSGHACIQ
jgi:parallel beta-helix repeat protein